MKRVCAVRFRDPHGLGVFETPMPSWLICPGTPLRVCSLGLWNTPDGASQGVSGESAKPTAVDLMWQFGRHPAFKTAPGSSACIPALRFMMAQRSSMSGEAPAFSDIAQRIHEFHISRLSARTGAIMHWENPRVLGSILQFQTAPFGSAGGRICTERVRAGFACLSRGIIRSNHLECPSLGFISVTLRPFSPCPPTSILWDHRGSRQSPDLCKKSVVHPEDQSRSKEIENMAQRSATR
jgi:hypothetical protein